MVGLLASKRKSPGISLSQRCGSGKIAESCIISWGQLHGIRLNRLYYKKRMPKEQALQNLLVSSSGQLVDRAHLLSNSVSSFRVSQEPTVSVQSNNLKDFFDREQSNQNTSCQPKGQSRDTNHCYFCGNLLHRSTNSHVRLKISLIVAPTKQKFFAKCCKSTPVENDDIELDSTAEGFCFII